jgi:hypothetical protein
MTAAEVRAWLLLVHAAAVVWIFGGLLAWIGMVLVGVIRMSTWLWQVPAHRRLEARFDAAVHRRLTRTNWVRAGAWTARSAMAGAMLARFQ